MLVASGKAQVDMLTELNAPSACSKRAARRVAIAQFGPDSGGSGVRRAPVEVGFAAAFMAGDDFVNESA